MDFQSVNSYLDRMRKTAGYHDLDRAAQEQEVFEATELLKDHFDASKLTDRAVALQVVYSLEGEEEEYAKLKRHGVKSYAVKGVSLSFEGTGISPDVITLLQGDASKARVGRLL